MIVRRSILVFAAGVLGVFVALGWMTFHALRLERAELEARRDAKHQESVRLALWRMDAAVTPIIAREAARPYFHYQPFYVPTRAYGRMLDQPAADDVRVPSPLLGADEPFVRVHYQVNADGSLISPQTPSGDMEDKDAYITSYMDATLRTRVKELSTLLTADVAGKAERAESVLQSGAGGYRVGLAATQEEANAPQLAASEKEYKSRQEAVTSAANVAQQANRAPRSQPLEFSVDSTRKLAPAAGQDTPPPGRARESGVMPDAADTAPASTTTPVPAEGDLDVMTGTFAPRWIIPESGEPELVFERTVTIGRESLRQGFWLDWPTLRAQLLASVADLFPEAKLAPLRFGVESAGPSVLGRTLAAIPAELVTPAPAFADIPLLTPVRTTLALTWALALAAVVVLALVLRAAMELAERRGQFVSAVTHELRTPLTTFVMYSQMLADGLVRDEESQRSYIGTLKTESTRLARIVESVLDYARLSKRQRPSTVRARLTAEQIVDNLVPVLRQRCAQVGMELVVERESLLDFPVTTDPPTLERIIFNLVDNACKYAANAPDKRIHLIARVERRDLVLAVKDHGPGIDLKDRASVFRAFTRGQNQEAGNIPGLGLGLALAQGLARELGGDLRLVSNGPGAEFHVRLPRD